MDEATARARQCNAFGAQFGLSYVGITSITYGYGGSSADNYYIATADITTITPTSEVPEPGSLAVLSIGLLGLGIAVRRRRSA